MLGHKSLIGVHEIKSLREFEVQCNSEEGKQESKGNGCYTVFFFVSPCRQSPMAVFIFRAPICVTLKL